MRWSQLFIPTLRDDPADADAASHRLLVRAGYIRQLAAGTYSYLYLGQRSLLKITQIVREEMDRIGAQEFHLPALHPAELWKQTGRWDSMADILFRFQDHSGRDVLLGPTHEEVMAQIASRELSSYRQLPQLWYQIQTKFRDEARPKSGLMRLRQFLMKDSYSFDLDEKGLDVSYKKHYDAYCRAFQRAGLDYHIVEAHSGAMGGSQSHEFMVASPAGEDRIALCVKECGYAANLDKATSAIAPIVDLPGDDNNAKPEEFATPDTRTIEELVKFTGTGAEHMMKAVIYVATTHAEGAEGEEKEQVVLAFVRGDHDLSEAKLSDALGGAVIRPALPEEVERALGAPGGSIGPLGVKKDIPILMDEALKDRTNLISGANKDGFHVRNLKPGRDFDAACHNLREVAGGDPCLRCQRPLKVATVIEVGHIFKLGRRYCEALGVSVLDEKGNKVVPIMGSYGIGMERILTSAVEQSHDKNGMILPRAIAPFEVVLTSTKPKDAAIRAAADRLYEEFRDAGVDVLYDDRDERPGVKFKDADLIGIPFRVTVGKKVPDGLVEVTERSTGDRADAKLSEVTNLLSSRFCG